ncbi:hypothetical protein TNCT_729071 [Trichonephila clavata]|uniref:Uncharacterized protein n=1 Tax=Trichonephila clavata TaxID=2740835 RepID=A0A8X6KLK9_TRICU|nr:hypothetical protein TNCT_729071 [Trichonephila clavata]
MMVIVIFTSSHICSVINIQLKPLQNEAILRCRDIQKDRQALGQCGAFHSSHASTVGLERRLNTLLPILRIDLLWSNGMEN